MLALLLACLIATVEVMLVQSYREIERATEILDRGATVSTVLANVVREANLLAIAIERLPRSGDLEAIRLRRAFLARQLSVLEGPGAPIPACAGPWGRPKRPSPCSTRACATRATSVPKRCGRA
jgi:hypothetical protein